LARGATLLRLAPDNQKTRREGEFFEPASLFRRYGICRRVEGESPRPLPASDTLSPDNGGGSGSAYWGKLGFPVPPRSSRAHSAPALAPGSHLAPALC